VKKLFFNGFILVLAVVLVLSIATWFSIRSFPSDLQITANASDKLKIADRYGEIIFNGFSKGLNVADYVELGEVDEVVKAAIIFAEDKRFYDHHGIDWRARISAIWQNVRAFRIVRGASTITEQVVRIMHPRPRNIWSRWVEGFEAKSLEEKFSKEQILEFYINQVPFTSDRRGLVQAAKLYFGRDLSTLTSSEIVALVALIRAPSKLDSKNSQVRLEKTADQLLTLLHHKNLALDTKSFKLESPLTRYKTPTYEKENYHFIQFSKNKSLSIDKRYFLNGILLTTLDAQLQKVISKILNQRLKDLRYKNVRNAAALVVNHESGEILAWVNASRDDSQTPDSYIDAVLSPRQPGSTLKPFLYALALEKGWTPATLIEDQPLLQSVGLGIHSYRNYSRLYYGDVRLRDALANSLNTPAVRAIGFVGVREFFAMLKKLGFESLTKAPDFYGEGLALGNGEVSLFELVQAYATLARRGLFRPITPFVGDSITREDRIISEESASIITSILSDRIARRLEFGTSGLLNIPGPAAIKTGTSTDFKDVWILGFSGPYTVGVWMGNLDGEPTRSLTGATGPAIVLRAFFNELFKRKELYLPKNKAELIKKKICSISGKIAGKNCPAIEEVFDPNNVTNQECEGKHTEINIMQESIKIMVPSPGLQIAMDPRIPDNLEMIALRLNRSNLVAKTRWYVDGEYLGESDKDHMNWPIKKGKHTVWAEALKKGDSFFKNTEVVNFTVK
jgi:penicillin-binding protein 1C